MTSEYTCMMIRRMKGKLEDPTDEKNPGQKYRCALQAFTCRKGVPLQLLRNHLSPRNPQFPNIEEVPEGFSLPCAFQPRRETKQNPSMTP